MANMNEQDDFISQTIQRMDQYLVGERQDEERKLSLLLRDRKDNAVMDELEQAWPLESERSADEWDAESLAAYEEWSREVDEELWDKFCGVHGDERDENGLCPQCRQEIAEELRNDH